MLSVCLGHETEVRWHNKRTLVPTITFKHHQNKAKRLLTVTLKLTWIKTYLKYSFYTPPHDRNRVLWYHNGRLSVCLSSIRFSFPDENLSKCKCQCIFTKLGMCIDIEIWCGTANGQILSVFESVICRRHIHIFHFGRLIWVNIDRFSPNLVYALIFWRSGLGLLMGKFCQFLTELFACDMIMAGYYCCMFLFSFRCCYKQSTLHSTWRPFWICFLPTLFLRDSYLPLF